MESRTETAKAVPVANARKRTKPNIEQLIGFEKPNQTHLPEPNNSKVNQHKNETLFQRNKNN